MRGICLLLFSSTLTALPASAQNLCQTGIHRLQNHDPIAARESLEARLQQLFADGATPDEGSRILITLPATLVPDCPEGALEMVNEIRQVGDDLYTGRIMPTNISGNGHVFLAQIVFTAADVLEWKPWDDVLGGPLEGGVLIAED